MITGFAHQATPLDAMRMGVRDYLDKNQDLDRDDVPQGGPPPARSHPPGQARTAAAPEPGRLSRGRRKGAAAGAGGGCAERPGAVAGGGPQPVSLPAAHHRLRATASFWSAATTRRGSRRKSAGCTTRPATRSVWSWCRSPVPWPARWSACRSPVAMNELDQVGAAGSMELQPFETRPSVAAGGSDDVSPGRAGGAGTVRQASTLERKCGRLHGGRSAAGRGGGRLRRGDAAPGAGRTADAPASCSMPWTRPWAPATRWPSR